MYLSKQIYSPRLYKYRDSYVLYISTVHTFFGSLLLTHTLLVQTHVYLHDDVSAPWSIGLKGTGIRCESDMVLFK